MRYGQTPEYHAAYYRAHREKLIARAGAWERSHPERKTFYSAKSRCRNVNNVNYRKYGARGIEFRYPSIEAFLSELGPRPSSKHSLDRIDNTGHYEPGNCRWATLSQQRRNQGRFMLKGAR